MTARRSSPIMGGALCLLIAAIMARMAVDAGGMGQLLWSLTLGALFLVLFSLMWWHPHRRAWITQAVLACQSLIVLALVVVNPHTDYVPSLFAPLAYQAATVLGGRRRWVWPTVFVLLTAGSLMVLRGPLEGLALALLPMAGEVLLPAFAAAHQEVAVTQAAGLALIAELEEGQRQLRDYVEHVEELATLEERNHLARELHDSVSQTVFSILLSTRSAQIIAARDPARLGPHLAELHRLTQSALAQMRGLIDQLRPPVASEDGDVAPRAPTPTQP